MTARWGAKPDPRAYTDPLLMVPGLEAGSYLTQHDYDALVTLVHDVIVDAREETCADQGPQAEQAGERATGQAALWHYLARLRFDHRSRVNLGWAERA